MWSSLAHQCKGTYKLRCENTWCVSVTCPECVFCDKKYGYEVVSVECRMDPNKKQLTRKGQSQSVENHSQHLVVHIETVFTKEDHTRHRLDPVTPRSSNPPSPDSSGGTPLHTIESEGSATGIQRLCTPGRALLVLRIIVFFPPFLFLFISFPPPFPFPPLPLPGCVCAMS